jgi:glycerol-3-phosphate acyltransferase PlsX
MRIGIDIPGGDFAPVATVCGSILAYNELKEKAQLVLFGDRDAIESVCQREGFDSSVFEIVHTDESIGMDEYPAKAFKEKPNASIVLGFKYLKAGKIDAFASAGNTGAMLVGSMHIVKGVPGVIRPCITAPIPKDSDKPTIVLDVGLNADSKPDVLYQYGILGSMYAELVYNIKKPRVALFNIGAEEEKGNLLTKATHQAMKDTKEFNFVGNVEGTDIFNPDIDVIVCDGFVGNTILKGAEAFYNLIKKRGVSDSFFDKFDARAHGGTPVLGINSTAIIAHGNSDDRAIKSMIMHTAAVVEADLTEKIKKAFE